MKFLEHFPKYREPPRFFHPPMRVFWLTGKVYSEGIKEHKIDGVSVKTYSIGNTIVDCFKYRNKLGLYVALEALKEYWEQRERKLDDLLSYAKICMVDKVMRPYLEALV